MKQQMHLRIPKRINIKCCLNLSKIDLKPDHQQIIHLCQNNGTLNKAKKSTASPAITSSELAQFPYSRKYFRNIYNCFISNICIHLLSSIRKNTSVFLINIKLY